MSEPVAAERRLAAILVADVAAYSRLVHENEAATVERLGALRRGLDDILAAHGGRIVSSAGDGFLAAFDSALDAAAAALEIQRFLPAQQQDIPEAQRLRFRIGLNVGDVLAQQDDLFGDAVNIAARLQTLAEPGGICATRAFRDSVRGRMPCAFDRIGRRQVKNIARPVTVYRLLPPGQARPLKNWVPFAAAAAMLVLIVAAAIWAALPEARDEPAASAPVRTAPSASAPPAPVPPAKPTAQAEAPPPASGSTQEAKPRQSVEGTAGDPPGTSRDAGGR